MVIIGCDFHSRMHVIGGLAQTLIFGVCDQRI